MPFIATFQNEITVEGLKHLGAKHWMVGTVGDQALATIPLFQR
jgi:hypothetical protein